MSIYKRKETWWIQFTAPDGRRIQQTAGTQLKQEAQELHDQLKADAWRVKNLGDKPRYTWQEAVVRWLTEQGHKKSIVDDKMHLRWLTLPCECLTYCPTSDYIVPAYFPYFPKRRNRILI
jgi:hypothetical protein